MKLAIADPPYLGRAVRWYGAGGCGDGYGKGQADNHPEAHIWDKPETHQEMVRHLETNYDGWVIALSVHSLSTYLEVIKTDSRNGIRVMSWVKPSAVTSGSRITNTWEPVIVRVPASRKGWNSGERMTDTLICPPMRSGFVGAKPEAWTHWVLDAMGYVAGDEVIDLFNGSGAVSKAVNNYAFQA